MSNKRLIYIGKIFNRPNNNNSNNEGSDVFSSVQMQDKMEFSDTQVFQGNTYIEVRNGQCTLKPM